MRQVSTVDIRSTLCLSLLLLSAPAWALTFADVRSLVSVGTPAENIARVIQKGDEDWSSANVAECLSSGWDSAICEAIKGRLEHRGDLFTALGSPHYYALIIGIDEYANSIKWPALTTPEHDASALFNLLMDHYHFDREESKLLLGPSATDAGILRALNNIAELDDPEASFLIVFTGHGASFNNVGYLVPQNGSTFVDGSGALVNDSKTRTSLIQLKTISTQIGSMSSRHISVIIDSCYSGTWFGTKSGAPDPIPTVGNFTILANAARGLQTKPAYIAMTSALSSETAFAQYGTTGFSPFMYSLYTELNRLTAPAIGAYELGIRTRDNTMRIANGQTPVVAPFKDTAGDFLFIRSN